MTSIRQHITSSFLPLLLALFCLLLLLASCRMAGEESSQPHLAYDFQHTLFFAKQSPKSNQYRFVVCQHRPNVLDQSLLSVDDASCVSGFRLKDDSEPVFTLSEVTSLDPSKTLWVARDIEALNRLQDYHHQNTIKETEQQRLQEDRNEPLKVGEVGFFVVGVASVMDLVSGKIRGVIKGLKVVGLSLMGVGLNLHFSGRNSLNENIPRACDQREPPAISTDDPPDFPLKHFKDSCGFPISGDLAIEAGGISQQYRHMPVIISQWDNLFDRESWHNVFSVGDVLVALGRYLNHTMYEDSDNPIEMTCQPFSVSMDSDVSVIFNSSLSDDTETARQKAETENKGSCLWL